MGLRKFSIEEAHHEHPRTADTQHDAQWQRTEGSIRGNGGCNCLFVEGLPWIARMGKPKRANCFKARDHDWDSKASRLIRDRDGPSHRITPISWRDERELRCTSVAPGGSFFSPRCCQACFSQLGKTRGGQDRGRNFRRNLAVSQIIGDTMDEMGLQLPLKRVDMRTAAAGCPSLSIGVYWTVVGH